MNKYKEYFIGGDIRSIGHSRKLIKQIQSQQEFDELFECLYDNDRIIKMRAIDVIEKITIPAPEYLQTHKKKLLDLCKVEHYKEYKWHLALLLPRLLLTEDELGYVWDVLSKWANDKTNSRVVRVLAMQGLYDLTHFVPELTNDLNLTMQELDKEEIPSICARIRIIKKKMKKQS
jgi:aspartokinase-like uncharacterized kinase